MKYIRIMVIALFSLLILAPLATFNFEEGAISEIDNRELTPNPFTKEKLAEPDNIKTEIENYLTDRIGFRDDMIYTYTVLNDRLFHKMVHPSYSYGKDGCVFGAGLSVDTEYTDYHETFADMVLNIQNYCDERSIPFLFVFNPAKPAVYQEYIPDGINYNRDWVDQFLAALDERGVRYVDNTKTLTEKKEEGEEVFNFKFDANHWNDTGAFYGTNQMLEGMKEQLPSVHVNTQDEAVIREELRDSLLVSEFPINEYIPVYTFNEEPDVSLTDVYKDEVEIDENYPTFEYYTNELRKEEGAPKALVFQGSYMNNYGYKFLANSFSEYIYVHDYQNVMNFPYYFNIFQPECVIFEVAEYTFDDSYFSLEKMQNMHLNPTLEDAKASAAVMEEGQIDASAVKAEKGSALTKITWTTDKTPENVWCVLGKEYDMISTEGGYYVTVPNEIYEQYKETLQIVSAEKDTMTSSTIR